MATSPADVLLYRTRSGDRLHLPDCIHLLATDPADLVPETEGDRDQFAVCSTCQHEMDGGRTEYDSFDEALEALPMPVENRVRCRALAVGIAYDRVYIPSSHPYIALATRTGVVAYFEAGSVWLQPIGGPKSRELFPKFVSSAGGTSSPHRPEPELVLCPVHRLALPPSGVCDYCG